MPLTDEDDGEITPPLWHATFRRTSAAWCLQNQNTKLLIFLSICLFTHFDNF